jgi:hypothetical protein
MFKILATIALLNTTNAQITAENTWAKTACNDQIEVFKCDVLKQDQDDPTTVHDCEAEYGTEGTKSGEEVVVADPADDASADDSQANDGFYTFEEY